jgi:hypothetical protein
MVIRKIGIGSAVKFFAVFYGFLGLLIGACVALFALIGAGMSATADESVPAWLGAGLGVGAIIAFPIFYAVLGVISGLITAGLFNIVAGLTGGLEIDVQ